MPLDVPIQVLPHAADLPLPSYATDGSAGVTTELRVGAEVDPLLWIALGVLLAGVLVGLGAAALIYVGSRRRA